VDGAGAVLRQVAGWHSVGAETQNVSWDGRVARGKALVPAAEGTAHLLVELRDLAGNGTALRRDVTVDRTLGFPTLSRRVFSPNGDGKYDSVTVGFKLTRPADVVLRVMREGDVVKTLRLGRLTSGNRTAAWAGEVADGGTGDSGDYVVRLSAQSTIGTIAVEEPLTIDVVAPKVLVPASATGKRRQTVKIPFTARDPYSRTVRVLVVVTDEDATPVTTLACGWVRAGKAQTCAWRPPLRGTYTLTFHALDQGANREAVAAATTLTVR